ncbi:MAG TPA: hypothetical protein VMC02_01740 [Steroidobacteraceae bacterium]|nr:hypothetical protein [Steroidobacteraceae bacterium]
MSALTPAASDAGARRRGVRRAALLLGSIAAAFYVGFIVMMIWRGSR